MSWVEAMNDLFHLIVTVASVIVDAPRKIIMQTSAPAKVPESSWKEVAQMLKDAGVRAYVEHGYPGVSPFRVPTYIVVLFGDARAEVHWQGYADEFQICISPSKV